MTDTNDPIDWTGKKKVNLALQGGGLHGAFTWGVLDYLLEDARLDIEAITGTSAGAMNAVVLAEGYLEGGRAGARKNLDKFWRSISDADVFLPPSESSWICFLDCRRWPRNGGPIFSPIIRALTIQSPEHQSLARSSRQHGRLREGAGPDRTQGVCCRNKRPHWQDQDF
jgi:Patatin-like phospholipase